MLEYALALEKTKCMLWLFRAQLRGKKAGAPGMILFDQDARDENYPRSLDSKALQEAKEQIDFHMSMSQERRDQTDVPPLWRTPFGQDVLISLERLTEGCCAFCERDGLPLNVYRFRPPAYAEPDKPAENKESYLWLAYTWQNLFPICEECRPDNANFFPVTGARAKCPVDRGLTSPRPYVVEEKARLFYPGEPDQPHRSFKATLSGHLVGLSTRANLTIEHFNLNDEGKVEVRKRHLEGYISALRRGEFVFGASVLRPYPPIRGARYLIERRIGTILAERLGPDRSLSPTRIVEAFRLFSERPGFSEQLEDAIRTIELEDATPGSRAALQKGPRPTRKMQLREYPRIAKVKLETYKSLESIEFTLDAKLSSATQARLLTTTSETSPEAPCVLILGENATGKSSILEAIALALMPETYRDRLRLNASQMTLNPEYMGAEDRQPVDKSRIEITFHLESSEEQGRFISLDIAPSDPKPFRQGGDRERPLPPVFAYGAHRLYGRKTRRTNLRHLETLFYNDRQMSRPEDWLAGLGRDDLNQVARALRHIIQIDGDFHTIEVHGDAANENVECFVRIERTRQFNGKPETYFVPYRLDIVSSGYRAVFGLVCDVLQGLSRFVGGDVETARNAHAVVLIDEIEAHLHPRWKMNVISGLRRALPKVTFIISSHDPLCVRGMYNGEVLALNRYENDAGTGLGMPERVEPVAGFENVENLTIEQILTSELFQLLSTDSPTLERDIALAADELSRGAERAVGIESLAQVELGRIVSDALPYGQNEISRIVQEAVAEYLSERRKRSQDENKEARQAAKRKIKERLRALMQ